MISDEDWSSASCSSSVSSLSSTSSEAEHESKPKTATSAAAVVVLGNKPSQQLNGKSNGATVVPVSSGDVSRSEKAVSGEKAEKRWEWRDNDEETLGSSLVVIPEPIAHPLTGFSMFHVFPSALVLHRALLLFRPTHPRSTTTQPPL